MFKKLTLAAVIAAASLSLQSHASIHDECTSLVDAQDGCTITGSSFIDAQARSVIKVFKGDNINRFHIVERDANQTDPNQASYWGYEAGDYTVQNPNLTPVEYSETELFGAMNELIIFIDGLNPDSESTVTSRFKQLKTAAATMHNAAIAAGKDMSNTAIILADGMQHGGDSVQDNAIVVKDILAFADAHRIDRKNITIAGISMGGVISRFALAELEQNGGKHNVGTYISYDAPHRGANVPQSIQNLLPLMDQTVGEVNNYINQNLSLVKNFGPFKTKIEASIGDGGTTDKIRQAIDTATGQTLTSMIGSQLLLDNVFGDQAQQDFQTDLDNLGYPTSTVNIAITNGSVAGTQLDNSLFPLNADGSYYSFSGRAGPTSNFNFLICSSRWVNDYAFMNIKLFPTVAGQKNADTNIGLTGKMDCPFGSSLNMYGHFPHNRTTPSSLVSIDEAPGSYMHLNALINSAYASNRVQNGKVVFNQKDDYTGKSLPLTDIPKQRKFTFIPTYSALDIDIDRADIYLPLNVSSVINDSQWNKVYVAEDASNTIVGIDNYGNAITATPMSPNFPSVDDNFYHTQPNAHPDLIQDVIDGYKLNLFSNNEKLIMWLNDPSTTKQQIAAITDPLDTYNLLAQEIDDKTSCELVFTPAGPQSLCTAFTAVDLASMIELTPPANRPYYSMTQDILDALLTHVAPLYLEADLMDFQYCISSLTPANICQKILP
jgi:hypothetical protein